MAEAEDLKSSKCGFDPHRGHVWTLLLGLLSAILTYGEDTWPYDCSTIDGCSIDVMAVSQGEMNLCKVQILSWEEPSITNGASPQWAQSQRIPRARLQR